MSTKEQQREYKLKSRYGITLEIYNSILKSQNNKCAICGKPSKDEKKSLCVDHNHKTMAIRGLLCGYCNSRLMKYLRDDKVRAAGLIKYLQKAIKDDKQW